MGETQISSARAFALHFLCVMALAAGYCLARDVYALSLVSHPAQTLCLLLVFEGPVVIGIYSWIRRDLDRCSCPSALYMAYLRFIGEESEERKFGYYGWWSWKEVDMARSASSIWTHHKTIRNKTNMNFLMLFKKRREF